MSETIDLAWTPYGERVYRTVLPRLWGTAGELILRLCLQGHRYEGKFKSWGLRRVNEEVVDASRIYFRARCIGIVGN